MQTHQLERKLKALKLGGMMDTLELRTEEAQKGNLGYLVFLEMLLEDEDNRRSQKALSGRLRRARFEESKTLSDFDFTFNPKIPAPLIRDLATCGYLERKESVLLYGPVGVGKSHIAQALGHAACMRATASSTPKPTGCCRILEAGTLTGPGKAGSGSTS